MREFDRLDGRLDDWIRAERMTEPGPDEGPALPYVSFTTPDGIIEISTTPEGPYVHIACLLTTEGFGRAADIGEALYRIVRGQDVEPIPEQ